MKKIFYLSILFLIFAFNVNAETLTVYPTLDGIVGYLSFPSTGVWQTYHDADSGNILDEAEQHGDATTAVVSCGSQISGTSYPQINRSFFSFDTSSLPDDCAIDSATFYLYPYNDGATNTSVSVQKGTQGDTLEVADYSAFSGSEYGYVAWNKAAGAYLTISFNSTGIADVSKTGKTYLCARERTKDYLNSTPNNQFFVNDCYYSEYTGTDHDPKLVITYTPAKSISGTLKENESDASGSAIDYLVVNRSTGAVVGNGTSDVDGTYSVNVGTDETEHDIYMLDLTSYLSKCIGEQVEGL